MTIDVIGPLGREPVNVLIDSGADYSIFDEFLAKAIGIDTTIFRDEVVMFGKAPIRGKKGRVRVQILGIYLNISAVFVPKLEFDFSLLGRASVFTRFNSVKFIEKQYPPRVIFD